jgi:dimethylhistidine N-methyltransferase
VHADGARADGARARDAALPSPPRVLPMAPSLRRVVLAGLGASPKVLPASLLYDAAGAALFTAITRLDAYYPTRTELAILDACAGELAALVGPGAVLLEYGSGEATKVERLLDALDAHGDARRPAAYVPIDVSAEQLHGEAERLRARRPGLRVAPVVADYTQPFELPPLPPLPAGAAGGRRVAFFPGSTIGNLHPPEAIAFLRTVAATCGPDGALILGVDLKKDPAVLHAAYNDPQGVTAAFNRNLLVRLNRELGATFDPARFAHHACYAPLAGRIEMHLVSDGAQTVAVAGTRVPFADGESIWTESSYKYAPAELEALAGAGGFTVRRVWTDARRWFAVLFLTVGADG